MSTRRQVKLGTKLLLSFLVVGVVPFAVVSLISLNKASSSLSEAVYTKIESIRDGKKAAFEKNAVERRNDIGQVVDAVWTLRGEAMNKLTAVRETKKVALNRHLTERIDLINNVKNDPRFVDGLREFTAIFPQGLESPEYKALYDSRIAGLKSFCDSLGFYDVFLIDLAGNVVFTVAKESDLGTDLVNGPLKETGLAKVFQGGKEKTTLVDMEWYGPSNEPAAFLSTPLKDSAGNLMGVAAVQISLRQISEIMNERSGLGETGETYLVGTDFLMRSDSLLDPENRTVAASFKNPENGKVETPASKKGTAGETGVELAVDYRGNPVVSAYTPVAFGDTTWALIAEIDISEVLNPKDENGQDYFDKIRQSGGYPDLYLMTPEGYCFYSAAKGPEFQTNMLTGKLADTNFGKAVKSSLQTKKYVFGDFVPYPPKDNYPTSFMVEPVINKQTSNIEVLVGIMINGERFTAATTVREGMGETGELFLVGPDHRLRGNSPLDPVNFTMANVFAKNLNIQSPMIDAALAGETGSSLEVAYTKVVTGVDRRVLTAYTPVKVSDSITWMMGVRQDQEEAFAAVTMLRSMMMIVAVVGIVAIILIALLVTRSITGPISKVIEGLNQGADQVAAASGEISGSSQSMAEGASEQASSLEEISSSLEETSSMTRQNADNARQANVMATEASHAAEKGTGAMGRMSDVMAKIKTSSDETAKIIKTIDEIAFQTNLLALNAAVEAARAGEAGKGFAVVAEEVRNLAQRSSEAAKNTSNLIEGSQKNAEEGVAASQEVGGILREIVEGVQRVAQLIGEVTAASQEQAQGIEQINTAVAQLDKVTQSNAATAEESASASEELNAQAEELKQMVGVLMGIIGGSKALDGRSQGRSEDSRKNPRTSEAKPGGGHLTNRIHTMLHHEGSGDDGKSRLSGNGHHKRSLALAGEHRGAPEQVFPLEDDDFKDF